jgi:hypothetical protein
VPVGAAGANGTSATPGAAATVMSPARRIIGAEAAAILLTLAIDIAKPCHVSFWDFASLLPKTSQMPCRTLRHMPATRLSRRNARFFELFRNFA